MRAPGGTGGSLGGRKGAAWRPLAANHWTAFALAKCKIVKYLHRQFSMRQKRK